MNWFRERFREPSTWTALAVLNATAGLFFQTFLLEPLASTKVLLGLAVLFALIGVLGRDGQGRLFRNDR